LVFTGEMNDSDTYHLWHLSEDLGEQENLAGQEPERVRQMYDTMTAYFKRVGWDESQAVAFPWENDTK